MNYGTREKESKLKTAVSQYTVTKIALFLPKC